MAKQRWTSRAVVRFIEAGSSALCAYCEDQVKFRARMKAKQVICNVYERDRWVRVEHYHRECYDAAGEPHGTADDSQPLRPKPRAAAAAAAATATATAISAA